MKHCLVIFVPKTTYTKDNCYDAFLEVVWRQGTYGPGLLTWFPLIIPDHTAGYFLGGGSFGGVPLYAMGGTVDLPVFVVDFFMVKY